MLNRDKSTQFMHMSILLLLFCVTKVIRGSDITRDTAGGIWNLISLMYYIYFAISIVYNNGKISLLGPLKWGVLYGTNALLCALLSFDFIISVMNVYNYIMIPYFAVVMYCFYYYAKDGYNGNSDKFILICFYICLVVNLATIVRYQLGLRLRPLASDIYFSLCLFPFAISIINNKAQKVLIILGVALAVFLSGKRTGMIAFGIAIMAYLMVDGYINNRSQLGKRIRTILLMCILMGVLYYLTTYIDSVYNLNIYSRLFRIVEDGGSGRDLIYQNLWAEYTRSPILYKLFGHGLFSTNSITGMLAHNDFLEVIYDYGIINFVFIISFYVSLVRYSIKLVKRKSKFAAAFVASIIISTFLSLFSFFLIYFTYVTPMAAFWGTVMGSEN